MFYIFAGYNVLYTVDPVVRTSGRHFIPKRSMVSVKNPDLTIAVVEPNLGPYGRNNHSGAGQNVTAMDGSGRWVSTSDAIYAGPRFCGGAFYDYYSDPQLQWGPSGGKSDMFLPKGYTAMSYHGGVPNLTVKTVDDTLVNADEQKMKDLGFHARYWRE